MNKLERVLGKVGSVLQILASELHVKSVTFNFETSTWDIQRTD